MSLPPFSTKNDSIFEILDLFIIATPDQLPFADLHPFDVEIRWVIDPTRRASATFLDILQRLDGLTFGPTGMPMDKWVFYDCAELPGFIVGFAIEAAALTPDERLMLRVPDGYEGPVPLSMYIAIPMRAPGHWFGHNLASLGRQLPRLPLAHLGTLTKVMALRAMRAEVNVGITQWPSQALFIHTKFGPLDLLSTWTPVHSFPASLTYRFPVSDTTLRAAAGDPALTLERPTPTRLLDATDHEGMQALQRAIEGGQRLVLSGPPRSVEGEGGVSRRLHPIAELDS